MIMAGPVGSRVNVIYKQNRPGVVTRFPAEQQTDSLYCASVGAASKHALIAPQMVLPSYQFRSSCTNKACCATIVLQTTLLPRVDKRYNVMIGNKRAICKASELLRLDLLWQAELTFIHFFRYPK